MTRTAPVPALPAVILAGGAARRMGGGDKLLLPLGGAVMLDAILDRLAPQVVSVAINAGGDPARFARWGLPLCPDRDDGRPGPLAGVLAAMERAAALGAERVVTVPGDTPFLPRDLVLRLCAAAGAGGGAVAAATVTAGAPRLQPTFALWPVAWQGRLAADLASGARRLADWALAQGAAVAVFPAAQPDPFFNVNTPDDLMQAQVWADRGG